MTRIKTQILYNTFFLLFFSFLLHGQGTSVDVKKTTIIGAVIEQSTGAPLEYATISIFDKKNDKVLGGGLTDLEGKFSIEVKQTEAYMKVDFIGYDTKTIDPIPWENVTGIGLQTTLDIGQIVLSQGGLDMEEITIQEKRSTTEFSLDKKIFNVGSDLGNRGGNAEDLLRNVPSVNVDIEGVVTLRGSSGVRILINGKPSNMASGDNANSLKNISTAMIERVEVITNPSSRYEAEGVAGIINIVLKKDNSIGFNGSFDGSLTYPIVKLETDRFPLGGNLGANVNYRKGRINWFAGLSANYRYGQGGGYVDQEIYSGDTTLYTLQESVRARGGWSQNVRFGIDYYFNEKSVLTGSINYRLSQEQNLNTITYIDSLNYNDDVLTSIRTDNEFEDESGLQYNINYRKEFSSRDHKLDLTVQYEDDLETEGSDLDQVFDYTSEDLFQRSRNSEGQREWLFQADYVQPLPGKDHKVEFGARSSIRIITNDYMVSEQVNDEWVPLEQFTNEFLYDEKIHAMYAQYGKRFGNFSAQVGLRGEFAQINTELKTTNELNQIDTFNLFPSLFLNYEFSELSAIQANYSRRIRRPRFWDLNPFFTFTDNRNFWSGNPNLKPEYTDSYEINYLHFFDKATFSAGFFYRHTKGEIDRIQIANPDGTFTLRPENLNTKDDFGLDVNLNYTGISWMRLSAEAQIFRSITNGENIGSTFIADTYASQGRVTGMFTLWDKSDFQIRGSFRGPRATTQGNNRARGHVDLAWSKDILPNKNVTITVSLNDAFNSRKRIYENFGPTFYRAGEFQWRSRELRVSANYRINQKKSRGGGGMNSGGDGDF